MSTLSMTHEAISKALCDNAPLNDDQRAALLTLVMADKRGQELWDAAGKWLPIETAPKDGTAILLGSRGGAWIGKWLPVYTSGYRPDNPWSSLMLNHDHMGEKWCRPSHWMPLPPKPEV